MRGMPNLTVLDPCDAVEIDQATRAIANSPGPVYMRLLRGKVPKRAGRIRLPVQTWQGADDT